MCPDTFRNPRFQVDLSWLHRVGNLFFWELAARVLPKHSCICRWQRLYYAPRIFPLHSGSSLWYSLNHHRTANHRRKSPEPRSCPHTGSHDTEVHLQLWHCPACCPIFARDLVNRQSGRNSIRLNFPGRWFSQGTDRQLVHFGHRKHCQSISLHCGCHLSNCCNRFLPRFLIWRISMFIGRIGWGRWLLFNYSVILPEIFLKLHYGRWSQACMEDIWITSSYPSCPRAGVRSTWQTIPR